MIKFKTVAMVVGAALAWSAPAAIWSSGNVNGNGTSLNTVIPDANLSGYSFALDVSGENWSLADVNVTLNFSGGFNGDLYAYLSYGGQKVELLNRVGTGTGTGAQFYFGYSTAGMNNVVLTDGAANGSIHNVSNPGSGLSYSPDGGSLATFNGMNPNGTWTLFFADKSGGNTTTFDGWSLDIQAVPEPTEVALGVFAGIGGLFGLFHWRRVRRLA